MYSFNASIILIHDHEGLLGSNVDILIALAHCVQCIIINNMAFLLEEYSDLPY